MNVVSLIIPIYNEFTYLRGCLDCIIRQDYPNLEVILVDDGSDIECLSISREYRDNYPNIRLIECENSGVSHARNVGINAAKGDLITFVDSDDLVSSSYVSSLVSQFDDYEVDIAASGWAFTSEKNQGNFSVGLYQKMSADEAAIRFSDDVGWFCASKMYRKSALPKGLFDEHIAVCEDLLFNLEALKRCRLVAIGDGVDYLYRQTTKSATNALDNPRWFDILDAYCIAMEATDNEALLARLNYSLKFSLCEARYRISSLSGSTVKRDSFARIERAKAHTRDDLPMSATQKAKLSLFLIAPRLVMAIRRRRLG